MSTVDLRINIFFDLNHESRVEPFDQFRSDLDEALRAKGYGSCDPRELTAGGRFRFDCHLTNLQDGLNFLREKCTAMKPKPELDVTIAGTDKSPIEVFPNSALPEFLAGLEPKKRK